MLEFSTNQSGHVTILSLADWLNFSVASTEAEKTFIGSGPGHDFGMASAILGSDHLRSRPRIPESSYS